MKKGMVGWGRFLVKDVRTVALELSAFKRLYDCLRIDQFASGAVEQDRTVLDQVQGFGIDQVERAFGKVEMEGEDIGALQRIFQTVGPFDLVSVGKFIVPVRVVRLDFHLKSLGPNRYLFPNPAESDYGKRFAHDLVPCQSGPLALAGVVDLFAEVPAEGK